MTIIEHLERHLGPIAEGWGTPISSDDQSRVRIVRFSNVPYDGAMTFCTVGHSDHVAEMDDGRTVRQELLFSTAGSYPADQVASFLLTLSSYLRSRTKALLRGEVIGPSAPVIPEWPQMLSTLRCQSSFRRGWRCTANLCLRPCLFGWFHYRRLRLGLSGRKDGAALKTCWKSGILIC